MKKFSTIAIAMSALLFVSAAASAQNPSSRNMEKRGQVNQNDQYNRDNDDDLYNRDDVQYDQRNERVGNHRRKITVVFGGHGRMGNDRYNDQRRYNRYDRYNDHRRYSRYNRYDRYHNRRSHQGHGY